MKTPYTLSIPPRIDGGDDPDRQGETEVVRRHDQVDEAKQAARHARPGRRRACRPVIFSREVENPSELASTGDWRRMRKITP